MPELSDPVQDLWIALAQPESLERVVEIYRTVESLAEAGKLPADKVGDLLAQAFSAMKHLAGDDPIRSRDLILCHLLPRCMAKASETDRETAQSQYREILGGWLENLSKSGATPIRDEVVEILRRALSTDDFEPACWTLFGVGFRTDEIVEALWSIAERQSGEAGDAALATLVELGADFPDRNRLLAAVHSRARLRQNNVLIGAIWSLGDPASLDLIEEAWLGNVTSSSWIHHSSLIVRVLSSIANANPDRPDVQDRAWNILSELVRIDPERMGSELALGGDLATLCDSPAVVPDLLKMLDTHSGSAARDQHFRKLLYSRVRDCVRPRQLTGWSAQVAESTLAAILNDATRDTKAAGMWRTLEMDLKRHAWDVLLSVGHADVLSPEMFEAALATETSPFVRQSIINWLACFRYREIPSTVKLWVTENRRIARDAAAADLIFRIASTRLLQSAESREAFHLLLGTGFSLEGSALLSSLVALSEVSYALDRNEDTSIADELVAVLSSGMERNQRVAAGAALVELAANARIPERLAPSICRTALQTDRDDSELSRIVNVVGFLPRSLVPAEIEDRLFEWARGTGQLAQRAVEALVRQELLLNRPSEMPELVGLVRSGRGWVLSDNRAVSDRNAYPIALLFEVHPDSFQEAISQCLREKDWVVLAQVVDVLDRLRESGREPLNDFVTAIVARISRQTAYTTETELFDILRRWHPVTLAEESWESIWDKWMPDARVALADALGRLAITGTGPSEGAIAKLLGLTQDGVYAVRRSAYRALAFHSVRSLRAFCETSVESDSRELRRRGAEACGWIDVEEDFGKAYTRFAADPEKAVREAATRSRAERQSRRYADASLTRVKAATLDTDEDMLAAWPYGRALARTGDDDTPRAIREHAGSRVFHGHIAYWLGRIADGLIEHWKEVTQKWPDPWYSWEGAIARGTGKLTSASGESVAVEYCVVKEPARQPTVNHSWHGVAWATEPVWSLTFGDRELELILADGSRGRIVVSTTSFESLIFAGSGPYPN